MPTLGVRAANTGRAASGAVTMLAEVDKSSWCQKVENADGLVVVFFYAPWCRNCKAVRPRLERIEREFKDASFYQANFKREASLCYEERVFTFPVCCPDLSVIFCSPLPSRSAYSESWDRDPPRQTVHFYLPGIGRVSRSVLTAKDTDRKMRAAFARFLGSQPQLELLQEITTEAFSPIIHYKVPKS